MTFKQGFKGLWGKAAIMLSAVMILLLAASAIGCVPEETTPTTPTTPTTHEVLNLKLATYIPEGYPKVYEGQKLYCDEVNKRGEGIVHIDVYWGGTLLNAKGLIPGLQDGTADLIFHTGAYLLGTYPIVGIEIIPVWKNLLHTQDMLVGTPLYELKNEVLAKKNMYEIAFGGGIPEFIFTRDKEVHSPEDMKGMRIRAAGLVESKVAQALGAAPATIPSADLPEALNRGTVDGTIMNPWTAMGQE
jgi:TRAP-type C4-dicarboxylate transport system, periplasmic component